MVAQGLDADLSVVAIQGIGSACGGQSFTMNEVYNTYPRINEGDYTYDEERSADIVVINMLANDAGYRREARLNIEKIVEKSKGAMRNGKSPASRCAHSFRSRRLPR